MGPFVARVPFVLAERHVDYQRILTHIDTRRAAVEKAAGPAARRLGWMAVHNPVQPLGVQEQLAARLERTLTATFRFGHQEARTEVRRLRKRNPDTTVSAGYIFPDAGKHGRLANYGPDAVRRFIRQRSQQAAQLVAQAAQNAVTVANFDVPDAVKVAAATLAATKTLHNSVLELVGETLNLGRTSGVLSMPGPPQYAMRSEQLDANTCDPCGSLHGEIAEIGSADYYDLLPPSGCLGGGRCRGIMVYGDEPVELQQAA